jgi:Polysaccharide biosynthesis enzyme WcbI
MTKGTRVDVACVFGALGNLSDCLGRGWSIEDHYAWAVDNESELRIPLPGDDAAYAVRFQLHPLVYPDVRPVQRLTVLAGGVTLITVELTARCDVAVDLPPALTRGQTSIDLVLHHPDGIRPSDARLIDDNRVLSVCFHTATVTHGGAAPLPVALPAAAVQAVIAGNYTALQLSRIFQHLPALRGRLAVQYIDLNQPIDSAGTLRNVQVCWLQADVGRDGVRQSLRASLTESCMLLSFPTPRCNALWPFQGEDPRSVPEPGSYPHRRYAFTDRIAAWLSRLQLGADVVRVFYDSMVQAEMSGLEPALALDLETWRKLDARCDIKLVDWMGKRFRNQRLFLAPTIPAGALVRELALRLLEAAHGVGIPGAPVAAELDRLMEGYIGLREELPINPRVARHFQLAWWHEDMTYLWHDNRYSFWDYMIDYITWAPWRP